MNHWESKPEEYLITYLRKNPFIYNSIVAILRDIMKESDIIIEFGCGTGALIDYIKDLKFAKYIGFDITEKVINIASNLYRNENRIFFKKKDILKPNNIGADIVIVKDLYEHLEMYDIAIYNTFQSFKKYGILAFFNVYEGKKNVINDLGNNYFFSMFSEKELDKLILENGVEVIKKIRFPELKSIAKKSLEGVLGNLYHYQNGYPVIYLLRKLKVEN